jgi:hypothetical protein
MATTTFSGPIKAGTIKDTTGTTVGSDVANQGHVLMVQSFHISHTDTTDTSETVVIPAKSHIKNIFVNVEVAFNAGTSNKLDVGIVGDSDKFIDNAEVGTLGTVALGATAQCLAWKNVGDTDVRIAAKYIPTGTAVTTGKARVCVVYAQARNHTD